MEFSWRTVMLLLGVMTVVIIVIDGLRRMRRNRAAALRLDIKQDFKFPSCENRSEFPSGGFRVIGESMEPEPAGNSIDDTEVPVTGQVNPVASRPDSAKRTRKRKESPEEPSLKQPGKPVRATAEKPSMQIVSDTGREYEPPVESSPSLDDSELPQKCSQPALDVLEPEVSDSDLPDYRDAPFFADSDTNNGALVDPDIEASLNEWMDTRQQDIQKPVKQYEPVASIVPKPKPVNLDEEVPVLMNVEELGKEKQVEESANDYVDDGDEESADIAMVDDKESEDMNKDDDSHLEQEFDDEMYEEEYSDLVLWAHEDAEQLSERAAPEAVLIIHVLSRSEAGFDGHTLLHLFNNCDLRLGAEGIFHRYEDAGGKGPIQFSISQTVEPGIFNPATMEDESFVGLTFFMSLPGARSLLDAYRAMSELAQVIAKHLDAELQDESRSIMREQTLEHYRQQVIEYERQQQLAMRAAAGGRR